MPGRRRLHRGVPPARAYREAPLMSVWEGSGNVRPSTCSGRSAARRDGRGAAAPSCGAARGGNRLLDAATAASAARRRPTRPGARHLAGPPARCLQAALLVRYAPAAVADAFCASRLAPRRRRAASARCHPASTREAIVERAARSGVERRGMKVVAIQPRVALGDVEGNLDRIEDLVDTPRASTARTRVPAREHDDAEPLPPQHAPVARPSTGALQILRRAAREHGCMVGGGYIAVRGAETRGTYASSSPTARPTSTTRTSRRSGRTTTTRAGTTTASSRRRSARSGWPTASNGAHAHGGAAARQGPPAGRRDALPVVPDLEAHAPWFRDRDQEVLLQYARETPAGWRACSASRPSTRPTSATSRWRRCGAGLKWSGMHRRDPDLRRGRHDARPPVATRTARGTSPPTSHWAEPGRWTRCRTFLELVVPESVHMVWYLGNWHGKASTRR